MRQNVLRAMILAALLALTGSVVLAGDEGPAWTYIEAGYLNVNPDNASGSGDNWFAGASLGFLKNFHVSGRYVNGDYADNLSQTFWTFAAGWHGLLGEKADVVAEATWSDIEVENEGDSGVGLTGGVRWLPIKMFEADGFVHWVDYSDAGSTDSYEVRGIFNVWRLGIGAAYIFSSEANQYDAFVRFNFGRK